MTMTYVEQAIQKAIEGGYNPKPNYFWVEGIYPWGITFGGDDGDRERYTNEMLFLDPLFWQSLAKSLGLLGIHYGNPRVHTCTEKCKDESVLMWHRFIDHLATGGTTESFFESLINVKG